MRLLASVPRWFAAVAMLLAAGAASADTLSLATYNVRNYGPANRVLADGFHPDYPKPEAEKAALRRVICAMNADMLVLQEMGTAPYLEELRRDLRADGCDYRYSFLATASDPDRHVALLSKRPLKSVATVELPFAYFGGTERVKRGVLVAVVATGMGDVTVFGVHLKSRLTERADDPESKIRRNAEATAVRDAVLKRFPAPAHSEFVIIGDCNDSKASKALARLRHRGHTPIAELLPAADSHGESWTYAYAHEDAYERIDHVLVSEALRGHVRGGVAHIIDGASVEAASDHRPVFVQFDLGPP